MARVSRKKQNLPIPAVDTPIRRWKTALYVRLSVEDNGKNPYSSAINGHLCLFVLCRVYKIHSRKYYQYFVGNCKWQHNIFLRAYL